MGWVALAVAIGVFVMIAHFDRQGPEDMDRKLKQSLPPAQWEKILREREESRKQREQRARNEREHGQYMRDHPPIP
jgi:hypothetical protein